LASFYLLLNEIYHYHRSSGVFCGILEKAFDEKYHFLNDIYGLFDVSIEALDFLNLIEMSVVGLWVYILFLKRLFKMELTFLVGVLTLIIFI